MDRTIVGNLRHLVESDPDKTAYVFVAREKECRTLVLTRSQLFSLGQKFASRLHKAGIVPGDVVCNTLPNSPERLITQFGTHLAGAIDMNGQICYADGEDFLHSLNQSKARAIILDKSNTNGAFGILRTKQKQREANPETLASCELQLPLHDAPSVEMIIPCLFEVSSTDEKSFTKSFFDDLSKETEQVFTPSFPKKEVAYTCTSGSTGLFKLVSHTNEFLIQFGQSTARNIMADETSVHINDRPLGWLGGHISHFASAGITRVLFDDSLPLSPDAPSYAELLWKIIQKEKATHMFAVRTNLEALAMEFRKRGGHRLEVISSGGGPLSKEVIKGCIGVVTKTVVTVYGSVELGTAATLRVTDPEEFEDNSVGYPATGREIKVVDEDLNPLPQGQRGEILVSVDVTCSGYVADEINTKSTFLPGGWIRLGDVGYLNAKNQLVVLGRKRLAILRGPYVVYPNQLEDRIKRCPGVDEVVICGVPDKNLYEDICALVEKESGSDIDENKLKAFCEENLFAIKGKVEINPMPAYFFIVKNLPRLANGKMDRSNCKKMATRLVLEKC